MKPTGDTIEASCPDSGKGVSPATGLSVHESMLALATTRIEKIHKNHVYRDPWPDFQSFDVALYSVEVRREAAIQWAGRARAEHGSVHQFSELTHALCESRAPLHLLGALTRLQTDEVRHAELCAEMALACYPEGTESEPLIFAWPPPEPQWRDAPRAGAGRDDIAAIELWAAKALLSACCLGEALSRPMLDAILMVSTDSVSKAVTTQILRDEHLHATFGFEALAWLMERLTVSGKRELQEFLRTSLASFERSTACGISISDIAESSITIEPGTQPNLGTLTKHQYAMIFFATLENEIFPKLAELGLDPIAAWSTR